MTQSADLMDVEVVLDDEQGAAAVDELAEGGEQLGDVVKVEAGGGLVEDVEGAAGGALRLGGRVADAGRVGAGCGEVGRELDALGFATGERRRGLAEAHVGEPDLIEHVELVDDAGMAGEVDQGLFDGHVQNVVDVAVAVLNLEDGGLVTSAAALFAGQLDVGEELHLDGDGAIALADVAAAAGNVEGEHARAVRPAAPGIGLRGEEGANDRRRL